MDEVLTSAEDLPDVRSSISLYVPSTVKQSRLTFSFFLSAEMSVAEGRIQRLTDEYASLLPARRAKVIRELFVGAGER